MEGEDLTRLATAAAPPPPPPDAALSVVSLPPADTGAAGLAEEGEGEVRAREVATATEKGAKAGGMRQEGGGLRPRGLYAPPDPLT